ncbi:MAG: glycerol-3-phosphate dehydrogenase/oxidase [Oleiphilaceae bacterium]|nr:glycerol-3-phosphate dehydrogenase/oxidase [Oleiphilaceae bacterium]
MIEQGLQRTQLDQVAQWDLIVIGGGITGAGILREAARNGYRALLLEQKDFTWGTSSRSSKMVHGGLRYLGSGHFGLTRDAVRERERMLRELPGLVDNLYYLMPHYQRQFPGPRIFGLLLWIYDLIAGRRTRRFYPAGQALQWLPGLRRDRLLGATRFSDAITEDSRLVMRLLHEACGEGAESFNYMAVTGLSPAGEGQGTQVTVEDRLDGRTLTLQARAVVSATGAWSDRLREQLGGGRSIRPLRGSHLIFPFWRLPVAASVSFFHPTDRRAMFVFPWEGITVVGTTDLDHKEDLDEEAVIDQAELDYLLEGANHVFPDARLAAGDVMSTWSGVRPVVSSGTGKDPSSESREHAIWDDLGVISVAGGKLTTFRLIAREVLDAAAPYLPQSQAQGDPDGPVFSPPPALQRPAGVSARQWHRLQGRYGPALPELLASGPLEAIGSTDTLWAELVWSARNERVQYLDDLLLRRTRLGLLLPEGAAAWLPAIRERCQAALGWDDSRWDREEARYLALWRDAYSLPPETR